MADLVGGRAAQILWRRGRGQPNSAKITRVDDHAILASRCRRGESCETKKPTLQPTDPNIKVFRLVPCVLAAGIGVFYGEAAVIFDLRPNDGNIGFRARDAIGWSAERVFGCEAKLKLAVGGDRFELRGRLVEIGVQLPEIRVQHRNLALYLLL